MQSFLNDAGPVASKSSLLLRAFPRGDQFPGNALAFGRFGLPPLSRVYMMGSREKVALCKVWLGFGLLMAGFISWTESIELQALSGNDIRCLSVDKDSCNNAEGSQCEWCELPQECYHREFVKKLGASCNGSQRRQLKDVQDCADIAAEEKCLSLDHCRWCRSDALDDGCFRAWEARKLPVQVFECSRVL